MMKAMGTECDQEIVQLVGSDDFYQVRLDGILFRIEEVRDLSAAGTGGESG
jgi:hypothetical protein